MSLSDGLLDNLTETPDHNAYIFMRMTTLRTLQRVSTSFITAVGLWCSLSFNAFAERPHTSEQDVFDTTTMKPFDGQVIRNIRVHGLKWTKEQAVRWLLSQHEGERFSPDRWLIGIHKLYDTFILYYVHTDIQPIGSHQIDIDLEVNDRWSLLPYGTAQSGGGSFNIGGGVQEENFLGYFAVVSVGYSSYDNQASYDVNYFQEFLRDTDLILGADVSQQGIPVTVESNSGQNLGNFIWQRRQQQILVGYHLPDNIRLLTFFELFEDRITSGSAFPEAQVYSGTQYRLHPVIIFGRSQLTNFLEQGSELSVQPTSANFFHGETSYSQIISSYKMVYLSGNTNYAFFINAGAMTAAPIPYLFHLGGFDTVRGFSTNRVLGPYYLSNNLEYRPYLTRFYVPLIGEIVTQGCVFQDSGLMWNSFDLAQTSRTNSRLFLLSEGIGLRLNFLRFAGAIVRIDVARTITPDEGVGLSFGVGQFF